jgi:nucleoside-diphosphate-sugar epimerase
MSTILVTGAAGLIGHSVATTLTGRGYRVVGTDLMEPAHSFTFVKADLGDEKALCAVIEQHEVDAIIHCGGISGSMLARDQPDLVLRTNVAATITLLEAARKRGMRRFVFCSSAQAYGDTGPGPVSEQARLRATDLYGASKGACDLLLRAYREQYGLDAVALRISYVYGPRRRTACAIRSMLMDGLSGRPTSLSWGSGHERAYLNVEDAVSGVIAAFEAPKPQQAFYNIASNEVASMDAIAAMVRDLIPSATITLSPGPNPLGYARDTLDISAARRDFAWAPQLPLKDGLARYLDWMRIRPEEER